MLSRNFSLQGAGDLQWIREFYEFNAIANSIDELIVLNVDRRGDSSDEFIKLLRDLGRHCFMPIAAGGGIRTLDQARALLRAGADKVVLNTPLFECPELVRQLVRHFGSQCVVASVDYKREGDKTRVYHTQGAIDAGMSVLEAAVLAQDLGAGELYLTSITRDGTGQGLDEDLIDSVAHSLRIPVIASGGAGNFAQLVSALQRPGISAVSTANLFNFMGDGLTEARHQIMQSGLALARWPVMGTLDED